MSHPDDDSDPLAILQYMLDHFSAEPGSILYRGPEMWEALPPGTVGQVLVLNDDLLPEWQDDT